MWRDSPWGPTSYRTGRFPHCAAYDISRSCLSVDSKLYRMGLLKIGSSAAVERQEVHTNICHSGWWAQRSIILSAAAQRLSLEGENETMTLRTIRHDISVLQGQSVDLLLFTQSNPNENIPLWVCLRLLPLHCLNNHTQLGDFSNVIFISERYLFHVLIRSNLFFKSGPTTQTWSQPKSLLE